MPIIFEKESLTDVMKDFYLLTGIRIVVFDTDLNMIASMPDTDTKFCAELKINEEFKKRCDVCTEEACLEFHVWFILDNEEWQIDMIQILKGSQFDGFFENVAERINAVLTPETRRTILELKYLTPDDEHIMGIEYYQAVIADGVKTYPDFIRWRKAHPVTGIVSWCP